MPAAASDSGTGSVFAPWALRHAGEHRGDRTPVCAPSEGPDTPGAAQAGFGGAGKGRLPGAALLMGASLATVSPIGGSIRLRTAWPQTSCSLFKLQPLLRAKAGTPRRAAPSAASCRPTPPPRRVWWLRLPLRAVLDPLGCPWRLGAPSAKRGGTFSVCTSSRALCPPGLGDPKASVKSELADLEVTTPICLAGPNLPHWGLSPCLHPLRAQLPPGCSHCWGKQTSHPGEMSVALLYRSYAEMTAAGGMTSSGLTVTSSPVPVKVSGVGPSGSGWVGPVPPCTGHSG